MISPIEVELCQPWSPVRTALSSAACIQVVIDAFHWSVLAESEKNMALNCTRSRQARMVMNWLNSDEENTSILVFQNLSDNGSWP